MRAAPQAAPAAARRNAPSQHNDPLHAGTARAPHGPSAGIRRIEGTLGNQAMLRLLQAHAIQPKLTVGPAGDAYEREAGRMADAVMSMRDGAGSSVQRTALRVQRVCPTCEDELQRAPAPIQRVCPECEKETAEQDAVPAQRPSGGPVESSAALTSYVTSSRGGGQPLPASVRARFESRFGHDFGAVRVHADARSHEATREIDALAFTSGSDIHFGSGQ